MQYLKKYPIIKTTLEAYFTTWSLMKVTRLGSGNVFTIILFLLVIQLYHTLNKKNSGVSIHDKNRKLPIVVSLVLSVLFTILYLLVDGLQMVSDLSNKLFQAGILCIVFCGMMILFYKGLLFLLINIQDRENTIYQLFFSHSLNHSFYRKHIGLLTTIICFICWIPLFLYQFPGIITPDSINQIEQVLGLIPYSNHHPWVHTLIIKIFYQIGSLFTKDLTVAIAFYTLAQMLLFAMSIGYLLATCSYLNVNNKVCIIITAYFALVPFHAVYAITIWKDILFAATILCLTCSIIRLSIQFSISQLTVYFLSCILFCLLRSNGWYAFLLCMPFLMIHFWNKWKTYLPIHFVILFLVLIIKIPVMDTFQVKQPDFVESLCIPLQQIANVIIHDRELTPEQTELIDHVIEDRALVKQLYVPTFADNMKELVRAGNPKYLEANKSDYFRLWLQLFIKYPGDYFEAHIKQTYGYWYPDIFYTVANNEGISPCTLDIQTRPIIRGPIVIKTKEILLKLYTMLPLYGLIWSIGFMGWLLLLLMGIVIVKKEYRKLTLYLPSFTLLLTVMIATPVASDFRYAYFLFVNMPLYLIMAFHKKNG